MVLSTSKFGTRNTLAWGLCVGLALGPRLGYVAHTTADLAYGSNNPQPSLSTINNNYLFSAVVNILLEVFDTCSCSELTASIAKGLCVEFFILFSQ